MYWNLCFIFNILSNYNMISIKYISVETLTSETYRHIYLCHTDRVNNIPIEHGWKHRRRSKRAIEEFQLESYNTYSSVSQGFVILCNLTTFYANWIVQSLFGLYRSPNLYKTPGAFIGSSTVLGSIKLGNLTSILRYSIRVIVMNWNCFTTEWNWNTQFVAVYRHIY